MNRMKRLLIVLYCFLPLGLVAQEFEYNYEFFSNSGMDKDYFYSRAEQEYGSFLLNRNFKLLVSNRIFHTPGNALELSYINTKTGDWKATIFHQPNRGVDQFKPANFFSCWMFKSMKDTTSFSLPAIRFMYSDSSLSVKIDLPDIQPNTWTQLMIPTTDIPGFSPSDPSKIIAVVFCQPVKESGKLRTVYIDDAEFVQYRNFDAVTEKPVVNRAQGFLKHVDIEWKLPTDKNIRYVKIYRSTDEVNFVPVGIQKSFTARYADYTGVTGKKYYYRISFLNYNYIEGPSSSVVSASTHEMTDDEMLTMVQEASFRYYWEGAEKVSGLAKEDIPGRHNMIATGASGFGIMATLVAAQRKFISRRQAVERFDQILTYLMRADRFHGAYPHFMNGITGYVQDFFGPKDNGADLVETSFLMEGLLAARQYFNGNDELETSIRNRITSIWQSVEWSWFKKDTDSKFLYWHWSPDKGWIINHRLIGWNETMVTYLLAIASPTHPVEASMYYSGWANQDSIGRDYRMGWGGTDEGSMYTNGNTYFGYKLDVGVSDGGPLFFTHYSYMGYDPKSITDAYTNYFRNNQKIALINWKYCTENPNHYMGYSDSSWGLSASDGPYHYSADEPVAYRDIGKITPTAAISSFPYTPEASMRALKTFYNEYGSFLWGEYGFRDAFNLTENWVSQYYMGLNQAPMTVMIENYRSGMIWNLFMKDPDIKSGLQKLNTESTLQRNARSRGN